MTDELKKKIAARAETDTAFQAALQADPAEAIQDAFGDALSDEDLDAIAGGQISIYLPGGGSSGSGDGR